MRGDAAIVFSATRGSGTLFCVRFLVVDLSTLSHVDSASMRGRLSGVSCRLPWCCVSQYPTSEPHRLAHDPFKIKRYMAGGRDEGGRVECKRNEDVVRTGRECGCGTCNAGSFPFLTREQVVVFFGAMP